MSGRCPLIVKRVTEVLQVLTCIIAFGACCVAFWRYNYIPDWVFGSYQFGKVNTSSSYSDSALPNIENRNVGWGFVMLASSCTLWIIFILVSFIRTKVMLNSSSPVREPQVEFFAHYIYRALMFFLLALMVISLAGDIGIGAAVSALLTTVLLFFVYCLYRKEGGSDSYYSSFVDEEDSGSVAMVIHGPPPPSDFVPPPTATSPRPPPTSSYNSSPSPPPPSFGGGPPPPSYGDGGPSGKTSPPPPPPPIYGGGPPTSSYGGGPLTSSYGSGPPPGGGPPGGRGGPPPPPPPPPSAAVVANYEAPPPAESRGALLGSIQNFSGGLKKTVTNDRSAPIF